jgi:hypothetical protein
MHASSTFGVQSKGGKIAFILCMVIEAAQIKFIAMEVRGM